MSFLYLYPPACAECNCWLVRVNAEDGKSYWEHCKCLCSQAGKKFKIHEIELEEITE